MPTQTCCFSKKLIKLHYIQHIHTTVLLLFWSMSGTTQVSRYQKGKTRKVKTNLDLLEQEIVSGSGICWAICKPAPHPRQPRQHPTTQFFTGRMPFLPPNQQRQSTEDTFNIQNNTLMPVIGNFGHFWLSDQHADGCIWLASYGFLLVFSGLDGPQNCCWVYKLLNSAEA